MRVWLVLVFLIILSAAGVITTDEVYKFKLPVQPHTMDFDEDLWSYSTEWTVEIPAPSQRPESVDIRALSTYVYKYIASNLGGARLTGGFTGINWKTSFVLEGVFLGEVYWEIPDLGYVLRPFDDFWGFDRPKVAAKARGSVSQTGVWPDPGGADTWTLKVRAVTNFQVYQDGPVVFGQSLKQRVKAKVRYRY